MRNLVSLALLVFAIQPPLSVSAEESESPPDSRPLRALLITGGCCHDYAKQHAVIRDGIQHRANVRVDVYWTDNTTTAPVLPLYRKLNWYEDYDVIIHDECAADIKDAALVNRIVRVHEKLPAVHLHCAMHSFRTGTDAWFQHLGLQSSGHGPQKPIAIHFTDTDHPITQPLKDWTTINEELYNNVKVFGAHPLAVGKQTFAGANPRVDQAVVAWTNESRGTRSFSTTIGHNTETVADPRYLDLVTRGLLWACGKLSPEYLRPYQGKSDTTFIDKNQYPTDDPGADGTLVVGQGDPYAKRGNIPPTITQRTPEEEAAILKDVRVPDGFEVSLFAAPPAVNYPVFVAATVDGTVFVSSDGNGSLGRQPGRGRIIRLRDRDGDGRADETNVFCEVDAPRGLVWDRDRLFVMHPPNLSVFFDHDKDGVADEQKTLVKNLAFGYDKRPADHTTNGMSLGVDGWLYIAGGDFGFMDALGADGTRLTHRGGGVIRVRPDGSGLEIYSTGTRNILEVAISPQMDLFARDNTNDGGGWDVRLHHFTGNDDHGYPRLYKNFSSECVQPLADYGGGSGCGAVYIDEPGFGRWNNAPFTADWGTGALYRHTVTPDGATFRETRAPEPFIKMTRPTDADVDGNSRVYCASWRGATFNWNGPNVGYIVCVKPKDFVAPPMPALDVATDEALITMMEFPSYRRRMAAQRELVRRGNAAARLLHDQAIRKQSPKRNLVESLQHAATAEACIAALQDSDPVVVHTAIRCLARMHASHECLAALDAHSVPAKPLLRALAMIHQPEVVNGLIARLDNDADLEYQMAILAALCRLHFREAQWKGDSWGTRPDTRGPYYQPETWSQSDKIAHALQTWIDQASPTQAARLIQLMQRNRMGSNKTLDRMLQLAETSPDLIGAALEQLVTANDIPDRALPLLQRVIDQSDVDPGILANAVVALTRANVRQAVPMVFQALARLDATDNASGAQATARQALQRWQSIDRFVEPVVELANQDEPEGVWADALLLQIAARKKASPESRAMAEQAIQSGWQNPDRCQRLMRAAAKTDNHHLDDQIWSAQQSPNQQVATVAEQVVTQLKIRTPRPDDSPKIGSLAPDQALASVLEQSGDVTLGQRVFTKANCSDCHTLSEKDVQKGPFLKTIAKTYKRPDLAIAILQPSKTIAQGFATQSIITVEGKVLTGFVTSEQADRVTIRDQQAKQHTIMKDQIDERNTLPTSVMPVGLMDEYTTHEFASLLDFLQSLP